MYQNDTTNTRDYTEITTETTNNNILSGNLTASRIPYKEIVDYLNEKTGKTSSIKQLKQESLLKQDGTKILDWMILKGD